MSVSVKDITLESFLSNLFSIAIDSEMRVEGKETDVTNVVGMATFIKQQTLQYAVNRNLLSRMCVRFLTFCANRISDSYSAILTMCLDQPTNQDFIPAQIKHSAQSV